MSKNDNLLTEGQVRQFMKLANLTPLTPGFVHGLRETGADDSGASKGDESATHKGEKDYTTKKGDELKHSGKGRGEKKGDEAYVNEGDLDEAGGTVTPGGSGGAYAKAGGKGIKLDKHGEKVRQRRALGAGQGARETADVMASAHDTNKPGPIQARPRTPSASAEESEIERRSQPLAGKAPQQESHGRGRGEGAAGYGHPDDAGRAGARLREDSEYDEHELENAEDDLEHADDLDIDAEEDLGDVGLDMGPDEGGREVSVDDFLVALEQALESVLGDEVEVEQDEEEDEEIELPLEGGEELDVGVEEELPLQEMINTITKRVAKRIVREALQNKK